MAASERALSRGSRRAERLLAEFGSEVAEVRRSAGVSQRELGRRTGVSASKVSRLEAGRLKSLSIWDASRIAAVIGLDLHVRAYPGGPRLRDAAHSERLQRLLRHTGPPLIARTEVPLPQRADQPTELRAWDAIVTAGPGRERTAIELEMRLRDAQALERRLSAKRRDDPVAYFLLAVADTRTNRRLLADGVAAFADLPRLKKSVVDKALAAGRHPGSGVVLV